MSLSHSVVAHPVDAHTNRSSMKIAQKHLRRSSTCEIEPTVRFSRLSSIGWRDREVESLARIANTPQSRLILPEETYDRARIVRACNDFREG